MFADAEDALKYLVIAHQTAPVLELGHGHAIGETAGDFLIGKGLGYPRIARLGLAQDPVSREGCDPGIDEIIVRIAID